MSVRLGAVLSLAELGGCVAFRSSVVVGLPPRSTRARSACGSTIMGRLS